MSQFQRQAVNMIHGQLETNSVLDKRFLELIKQIPREEFVPASHRKAAYIDNDIAIAKNRYLLAPMTFAKLVDLAAVTPSCRILVIGGGNGYATAILAELGGHVVSIENDSNLLAQSVEHMARLKIQDVNFQQVKNLEEGYQLSAPYDVIFINGAVEYLPDSVTTQLGIGGRLVAIRRVKDRLGKGILAQRFDGHVNIREYFDASASVLQGFELRQPFVF